MSTTSSKSRRPLHRGRQRRLRRRRLRRRHGQLRPRRSSARARPTVAQIVVNYSEHAEVAGRRATARGNVPGTDQRNAIAYAIVGRPRRSLRRRLQRRRLAAAGRQRLHGDDPSRRPGRSTASATTRSRWTRSPTASGPSPRTGSPQTASTSPTTSSATPGRSSATT